MSRTVMNTEQLELVPAEIDAEEQRAMSKPVKEMTKAELREAVLWLRDYCASVDQDLNDAENQLEDGRQFTEVVLCAVAANGGCLVAPASALADLKLIRAMDRKGAATIAFGPQKDGNVHIHARLEPVERCEA